MHRLIWNMLRDGRLGMPAGSRALRMLRSGMAAETTAVELGLARSEVQLLEKVAGFAGARAEPVSEIALFR